MKCKQKLCSRSKNLKQNGNCSVCEDVLENANAAHAKIDKNKTVPRVEVDLKQMVDFHKKLKNGENIDPKDVSALLLAGIINILGQHDALDILEEHIKALEHENLSNRSRIEALENWVMKQHDTIEILDGKLSTMDVNGAIVKESEDIKVLKKRILSLETDLEPVKTGKCAKKVEKANSKSIPIKCLECPCEFSKNCDLEVHLEEHEQEKLYECEVCGKRFFLKWRLKMHKNVHEAGAGYCHFFNNSKQCPYENIGCKFLHERSGACTFQACMNTRCQFEHSNTSDIINIPNTETLSDNDLDENDVETMDENIVSNEIIQNDSDNESATYGENDCHLCEKTFTCLDDLCDHFEESHEEYYRMTQNLVVV